MTDRHLPRAAAVINLAAFVVGIACIVLWVLDVESTVRIFLTIALFTFGPGSGLVQFLKVRDPALQIGILLALSASIDLVLAQILLSLGAINGLAAVIILTVLTCIRPIHRRSGKDSPVANEETEEVAK